MTTHVRKPTSEPCLVTEKSNQSIASLEEARNDYRFAFRIVDIFLSTTDREDFDERFGQLSEDLAARVRGTAESNVFAIDGIIAELHTRGGYVGGWIALREWAERQPEQWLNEAKDCFVSATLRGLRGLEDRKQRSGEIEADGSPSLDAVAQVICIVRAVLWQDKTVPDAEREELNQTVASLRRELVGAIEGTCPHPKSDARWIAIRDWARAHLPPPEPADEPELSYADQGRMLGVLRVQRMRAQTDAEREEIDALIKKLEADFDETQRSE